MDGRDPLAFVQLRRPFAVEFALKDGIGDAACGLFRKQACRTPGARVAMCCH
jgi:hypothetical protein